MTEQCLRHRMNRLPDIKEHSVSSCAHSDGVTILATISSLNAPSTELSKLLVIPQSESESICIMFTLFCFTSVALYFSSGR